MPRPHCMGEPSILEYAVLLGAAGLLLAVAVLTVIHLDAWSWVKENLRKCRSSSRCRKRADKREQRKLRQHQEGSRQPLRQWPTTEQKKLSIQEGDKESLFTGSDPLPQQPFPQLLRKSLSPAPCRCCGRADAKKECQFGFCATCCRVSSTSSCQAHGTGYQAVSAIVESACIHKYLQLDISYANLRSCPPNLARVGHQLVSLNLSNNRLTSLPASIGGLTGLEELFLQYNFLRKLPASICQLSRLVELDVKNNRLSTLPEGLGSLRHLTVLCLTNNVLTSLPPSIGKLTELEELSVHSNALRQLPDTICKLRSLKLFFSGENKLQQLPEQFGLLERLEELDLSGCELVSLPNSITKCRSLAKLWLSNNRLVSLPSRIGNLHLLKELHLRNNQLPFFPASISHLPLYTFTAQNNPTITEEQSHQVCKWPDVLFPSLLELAARAVVRQAVPWSPGSLPCNLERLLSQPAHCSQCGGPAFTYYSSSVVFQSVGVFYWLPLYQLHCSPHQHSQCRPAR